MSSLLGDFGFLAPKTLSDQQVFGVGTGVHLTALQVWKKPAGATMVYMLTLGGGGGGGGGFTRTAGSAGGGGGSGASSGICRMLIPAILLPDTLYIQCGAGGLGGNASGAGGNGMISYIFTSRVANLPNVVLQSNNTAPGGGAAGTGAAGGAAGGAPGISNTQLLQRLGGLWQAENGVAGVAGGAQTGAVGVDITAWSALCVTPGASGAGCTTTDFAGGQVTATAILDVGTQGYYSASAGGVAKGGTAAGVGVDGSSGVFKLTPLYDTGGAGGGSNNSGQAGNGGKGGYGCGGGGGGAGATGGKGGDGGPGLVIITSW